MEERNVTEREREILLTFKEVLPKLSDTDKSYLLGLGEGMAIHVGIKHLDDSEKEKKDEQRN